MKVYTGVGARLTPPLFLTVMEQLAAAFAAAGYTLWSGHSPGADQAFERGAAGAADIFLPWPTFGAGMTVLGRVYHEPLPAAYDIAAAHHPTWRYVKGRARALHARNSHQVLGPQLTARSEFLVCWTPDASLDGSSRESGGTGQAIRLAVAHQVPVYNLQRPEHLAWAREHIARAAA